MRRTVLLVLASQGAWAVCVVGATSRRPWVGPVVVATLLGVRIATEPHKAAFLRTVLGALFIGVTLDGLLAMAGVLVFPHGTMSHMPIPSWLVALWANFVLTLDALQWLASRRVLASALGALGGPLAYLAGARLGAVTLGPTVAEAVAAVALEWAVALPLLLWLAHGSRSGAGVGGQRV